jgi:Flp pilus assembly pilin Flp
MTGVLCMWLDAIRTSDQARRFVAWLTRTVEAQSTVEYALVGALVVIAAAAAMTLLGEQVATVFSNITTTLRSAAAH